MKYSERSSKIYWQRDTLVLYLKISKSVVCLFLPEHLSNNAILRERISLLRISIYTPSLQRRNAFNLHIGIQGQRLDGNTSISSERMVQIEIGNFCRQKYIRSAWLDVSPVLHIHRVHIGKVIHIGQEHVDLDHLVDIRSCGFEDIGQVLDTLVLVCVSMRSW